MEKIFLISFFFRLINLESKLQNKPLKGKVIRNKYPARILSYIQNNTICRYVQIGDHVTRDSCQKVFKRTGKMIEKSRKTS